MSVESRLIVTVDASGGIRDISEFEARLDRLDKTRDRTQQGMAKIGGAIAGAAAAWVSWESATRIMEAVWNETTKFESALAGLSSITGITGTELDRLGRASDSMSVKWGIAADEVLGVQKQLASLKPELASNVEGLNAVTNSALMLSRAQTDLSESMSAEAIGGTLNAFKLGIEETARVTDVLAESSRLGAREVPFLAEGLGEVGGVAKTAGESLETTSAAIETLGKTMDSGAQAGTHLRNIITILNEQAAKQGREYQGLQAEIDALAEKQLSLADATKIFGRESANSALQLINNREELQDLTNALGNSFGAASKQAATNMDTVTGAVDRLSAQWSSLLRSIGDSEVFKNLVNRASAAVEGLTFLLADLGLIEDKFKSQSEVLDEYSKKIAMIAGEYNAAAQRLADGRGKESIHREAMAASIKKLEEYAKAVQAVVDEENKRTKALEDAKKAQEDAIKAEEAAIKQAEQAAIEQEILNQQLIEFEGIVQEIMAEYELDKVIEAHRKAVDDLVKSNSELIDQDLGNYIEQLETNQKNLAGSTDAAKKAIDAFKSENTDLIDSLKEQVMVMRMTEREYQQYITMKQLTKRATEEEIQITRDLIDTIMKIPLEQQFREELGGIFVGFFDAMTESGTDAWEAMLEKWEASAKKAFNGELGKIISGERRMGSTGYGGTDLLSGIGAGFSMGNTAAGMQGQGTGSAMMQGALTGALAGGATGGWVGAIAGALVGAFTAGQSGQWTEVGRRLRVEVEDGLITGFMDVKEKKYSFGSSRTRHVMDQLAPGEQSSLQGVWNSFFSAFVDAGSILDFGDLSGRLSDVVARGFNIDISGMKPDEILAAANTQFIHMGSTLARELMPSLVGMRQEGENLAETFTRVAAASGSVNSFFSNLGFDPSKLIGESFVEGFVESVHDGMLGELSSLKDNLQIAFENGDPLLQWQFPDGTDLETAAQGLDHAITEVELAIRDFTLTEEELAQIQADAIHAWAAEVETALGGFDAMNEKFSIVMSHFFDTTEIAARQLENQVSSAIDDFESMLAGLADTGLDTSGISRENFGQFLHDAMSGALGALDPTQFAAIIDAGVALAQLMDLEIQRANLLGEQLDVNSMTIDQMNTLRDVGLEWTRTLQLMGHEFTLGREQVAQFTLDVATMVGSLEEANAAFGFFVETFFSESEQATLLAGRLSEVANDVGLALEDLDSRGEVAALMSQALEAGNAEMVAFLLNNAALIDQFISSLEGLDTSAGGASNAIDETSRALQENINHWQQVGSAIGSALASVQNAIASIRNQQYSLLGPGATGPGSIGNAISSAYGLLGTGSIEDQIGNIQSLQALIMQRYQMELQQINSVQGGVETLAETSEGFSRDEIEAQRRAHDAAMDYWNRMQGVAKSLRQYINDLQFSEMANMTPEEQLALAQSEFQRLLELALSGDVNAAEGLQGAAQTLLSLARDYFASSEQFDSIFSMVMSGLEQVASMAEGIDEPPPWVEPIEQGLAGVSGAVTSSGGQNVAAIQKLQDATIKELEDLEKELKRLQAEADAELEAAKQRLSDYQNNTESYQRTIARDTAVMASSMAGFASRLGDGSGATVGDGDSSVRITGDVIVTSERDVYVQPPDGGGGVTGGSGGGGGQSYEIFQLFEMDSLLANTQGIVTSVGEFNTVFGDFYTDFQSFRTEFNDGVVSELRMIVSELKSMKDEARENAEGISESFGDLDVDENEIGNAAGAAVAAEIANLGNQIERLIELVAQ